MLCLALKVIKKTPIGMKAAIAKALIKTAPLTMEALIIKTSVVKVPTANIMITRLYMVGKVVIGKYMLCLYMVGKVVIGKYMLCFTFFLLFCYSFLFLLLPM